MDMSTISTLSQALDLGSARVQAISNNLSNINTPGYKRQDATFAALLQSSEAGDTAAEATPDPRHLTMDNTNGRQSPTFVTQRQGQMRLDGNNVDVDAETSRLAASEIYFQGATQLLNMQFSDLKFVISGGK